MEKYIELTRKVRDSIWLFPLLVTFVLLLLTALQINGSSLGIYHRIFYGEKARDPALIANQPQYIRSDEWQWNSQMILAQSHNNYQRINSNLGYGQDMSITIDAPYKDWGELFHPSNWAFFVLPTAYAFAFKWWVMACLLAVACYFFILELLPGKRMFAALVSVAFLFSPFIQWWYQYITIMPLAFGLLLITVFMHIVRAKTMKSALLWSAAEVYLLTAFALVMYPPFQIPCAIVIAAFCLAYAARTYQHTGIPFFKWKVATTVIIVLAAAGLSALFLLGREQAVSATLHTVYPGNRKVQSGGYDLSHFLSGFMDFQLRSPKHVSGFIIPRLSLSNQSEESNFILLSPFLFLPGCWLLWRRFRNSRSVDWPLLVSGLVFILFLSWLFIPHLGLVGKITLLNRVPPNRLLIGFGLLNLLQIVLVARAAISDTGIRTKKHLILAYGIVSFIAQAGIALWVHHMYPGFIGSLRAVVFAVPVPIIVYCVLMGYLRLAAIGLVAFSLFTSVTVHPLYRGIAVVNDTPFSKAVRVLHAAQPSARWAVETPYLENMVLLNGAPSLSGTYSYPQFSLWQQVPHTDPTIYNRFSHVRFIFDRTPASVPTNLQLVGGGDQFIVDAEPCNPFFTKTNVHFIVTETPLDGTDRCYSLAKTVTYPEKTIYIYYIH